MQIHIQIGRFVNAFIKKKFLIPQTQWLKPIRKIYSAVENYKLFFYIPNCVKTVIYIELILNL